MIPLKLQYFKSLNALRFVTGGLASLFSGTLYQSPSYNRDTLGRLEHCCFNHRSIVSQCWSTGQLEYHFNATMNVFELNVTTLQVGGCSSKCCITGINRQYRSGVGGDFALVAVLLQLLGPTQQGRR